MTAGDVFSSGFTTSGTVAVQPASDVMLTSIMTSSDNGRIDMGGGYYMRAQSGSGGGASTQTSISKWGGASTMLNMKLFMTPTVFISLNSSSGTIKFHYSGVQM